MAPLSYIWCKIVPLSYTSRISQNNRNSYERHIFPGLSVLLAHLLKGFKLLCVSLCYFCPNLADFATLSYTKGRFFLHFIYCLLKGVPPGSKFNNKEMIGSFNCLLGNELGYLGTKKISRSAFQNCTS